jgi:hypothetical protein
MTCRITRIRYTPGLQAGARTSYESVRDGQGADLKTIKGDTAEWHDSLALTSPAKSGWRSR